MLKIIAAMAAAVAGLASGFSAAAQPPEPQPFELDEAVNIAVTAEDPAFTRFDARASAQEDRAVSDSQLPDPTLRTALANVPIDTFAFGQEPMTQAQVGLRQEIPRGSTLRLNREKREGEAEIERMKREATVRNVELDVRRAWFDKFYAANAQTIVHESRDAVSDLVDALSASFAQGKLTSQDVLRAEL
jgi:outer membrane protein TolC